MEKQYYRKGIITSHAFDIDNQALKDAVNKTVDFIKEIF